MTLTKLGNPGAAADGRLETFPIDEPGLEVVLDCGEFTCRCPVTGQPDWATIEIAYTARDRVVETKSLKLYLETYRERGIFHEHVVARIRDDLVAALAPAQLVVTGRFNRRGGIAVIARTAWVAEEAQAAPTRFRVSGHEFRLTAEDVRRAAIRELPERPTIHLVVVEGVEFPVTQLLAAATGLPRGSFTSKDAVRVLGELGFELRRTDRG